MITCGNCGAELPDGKKFCEMCGSPLQPTPAQPDQQPTQQLPDQQPTQQFQQPGQQPTQQFPGQQPTQQFPQPEQQPTQPYQQPTQQFPGQQYQQPTQQFQQPGQPFPGQQPGQQFPGQNAAMQPPNSGGGGKRTGLIIGIVVLVLIVVFGLFMCTGGSSKSSSSSSASNTASSTASSAASGTTSTGGSSSAASSNGSTTSTSTSSSSASATSSTSSSMAGMQTIGNKKTGTMQVPSDWKDRSGDYDSRLVEDTSLVYYADPTSEYTSATLSHFSFANSVQMRVYPASYTTIANQTKNDLDSNYTNIDTEESTLNGHKCIITTCELPEDGLYICHIAVDRDNNGTSTVLITTQGTPSTAATVLSYAASWTY